MLKPGLTWGTPTSSTSTASDAAAGYLHEQVENASPAELTNMIFVEVLRCLDTADALAANDQWSDVLPLVLKAQRIVVELRSTLNPEAGDISLRLDSIYVWAYENLIKANTAHDRAALQEARRTLAPIAEAWADITRSPAR